MGFERKNGRNPDETDVKARATGHLVKICDHYLKRDKVLKPRVQKMVFFRNKKKWLKVLKKNRHQSKVQRRLCSAVRIKSNGVT